MRIALPAAIAAFAFLPTRTLAEDWPQFRGPTGQGISKETGLPASWSTTKNVTWKVDVPGKGWSSPVIYKGRVYMTTAVKPPGTEGNDRSLRTLCFDAKTGKPIWDIEVFQQRDETVKKVHSKNSHASATPVIDGGRLFVHFGPQGTACLTLDGKTVWKTRELSYDPRHGNGNSPVVLEDIVFINCDGYDKQFVVALDRKTGKIRWKHDRPPVPNTKGFSFATPLVIEVDGKKRIISPGTDQVVAYEPQTGKVVWKALFDGFSVVPRPVYSHGLIVLSTSFMRPNVLAVRPGGSGDVTKTHIKWRIARGAPNTPSCLAVGDEVYFVSDRGVASCVDAKTGKMHWQKRLGGNYSASPIYADGKISFTSEAGLTTVIKPGKTFKLLAKNDLAERTFASIAVADGAFFIRTETKLYRIESPKNAK